MAKNTIDVPFLGEQISPVLDLAIKHLSDRQGHPTVVVNYATLKLKMVLHRNSLNNKYLVARAQLDKTLRNSMDATGEKYTEAKVSARVEMDKNLAAVKTDLDVATAWVGYLSDLNEALRQRKDMLMSLAADDRSEYKQL